MVHTQTVLNLSSIALKNLVLTHSLEVGWLDDSLPVNEADLKKRADMYYTKFANALKSRGYFFVLGTYEGIRFSTT
jgi:hypothetical protein